MTLDSACPVAMAQDLLATLVLLADRDPAKVLSFAARIPSRFLFDRGRKLSDRPSCTGTYARKARCVKRLARCVLEDHPMEVLLYMLMLRSSTTTRTRCTYIGQILRVYASQLGFYCDLQRDPSTRDQVAEVTELTLLMLLAQCIPQKYTPFEIFALVPVTSRRGEIKSQRCAAQPLGATHESCIEPSACRGLFNPEGMFHPRRNETYAGTSLLNSI